MADEETTAKVKRVSIKISEASMDIVQDVAVERDMEVVDAADRLISVGATRLRALRKYDESQKAKAEAGEKPKRKAAAKKAKKPKAAKKAKADGGEKPKAAKAKKPKAAKKRAAKKAKGSKKPKAAKDSGVLPAAESTPAPLDAPVGEAADFAPEQPQVDELDQLDEPGAVPDPAPTLNGAPDEAAGQWDGGRYVERDDE